MENIQPLEEKEDSRVYELIRKSHEGSLGLHLDGHITYFLFLTDYNIFNILYVFSRRRTNVSENQWRRQLFLFGWATPGRKILRVSPEVGDKNVHYFG